MFNFNNLPHWQDYLHRATVDDRQIGGSKRKGCKSNFLLFELKALPYLIFYALSSGVNKIVIFALVFKIHSIQKKCFSTLNKNLLALKVFMLIITGSLYIIKLYLIINVVNRNITIVLWNNERNAYMQLLKIFYNLCALKNCRLNSLLYN